MSKQSARISPHFFKQRVLTEGALGIRRENTIASLARVISEHKVSKGLRKTLLTQARRLEKLAAERLKDFAGKYEEEQAEE